MKSTAGNTRNKEHFTALLRTAGFKATSSRLAILSALSAAKSPMTAGEIISKLKQSSPDQATIYRAVKELKGADIIRQIDFQHGHAHYELASEADHHHLVCINCEKVEDFTGCNLEPIVKTAMKQTKEFKTVTRHSLELFGICKSCSAKKT